MLLQTIINDTVTPVSAFLSLQSMKAEPVYLLESVEKSGMSGRFSYIGAGIEQNQVNKKGEGLKDFHLGLRRQLKTMDPAEMPLGFTGFTSLNILNGKLRDVVPEGAANYILPRYVFRFDHVRRQITLFSQRSDDSEQKAGKELMEGILWREQNKAEGTTGYSLDEPVDNPDKLIKSLQENILQGSVHQVLASASVSGQTGIAPIQLYRGLRYLFPSPYMFFFDFPGVSAMGSSPGSFIGSINGQVEMSVLSGIRKGEPSQLDDQGFVLELEKDVVEQAKHTVLADKTLDDLSGVCNPESIEFVSNREIDHFSRELHMASVLRGKLTDGVDMLDAFCSAFPASTMTGSPKHAALELLMNQKRAGYPVFGGAAGHFSPGGRMDHALAVRTIVLQGGSFSCTSGALITANSEVNEEAQSIKKKNSRLLRAFEIARELQ